jgi:5-methylcytosine-specific restriction endonuclease McrA
MSKVCSRCKTNAADYSNGWCKSCSAWSSRRYYQKHPEKNNKKSRREAGLCYDCGIKTEKSRCTACAAKHRKRNLKDRLTRIDAIRAYDKARANLWNRRNRERVRERDTRKYKNNPAAHIASVRKWQKNNPERVRVTKALRRRRQRNAPGTYTPVDWQAIVERQDGKCVTCGISCILTVDHIVPLSRGGSNWPSNLQGLCRSCNSRKGNRMPQAA